MLNRRSTSILTLDLLYMFEIQLSTRTGIALSPPSTLAPCQLGPVWQRPRGEWQSFNNGHLRSTKLAPSVMHGLHHVAALSTPFPLHHFRQDWMQKATFHNGVLNHLQKPMKWFGFRTSTTTEKFSTLGLATNITIPLLTFESAGWCRFLPNGNATDCVFLQIIWEISEFYMMIHNDTFLWITKPYICAYSSIRN